MDPTWVWVLVLALTALVLFVVELFLPSGGIIATLSILALIGAVFCLFVMDTVYGLLGVVASLFIIPVAAGLAVKVFPRTPIGRRLILADEQQAGRNIRYSTNREDDYSQLMGAEGKVVTHLHPVGVVRFGDKRVNCLSERGVVEPGATVRVVGVSGMEVRVRQVSS